MSNPKNDVQIKNEEDYINQIVKDIMDNPDSNIGALPDFIERRIYKTVFSALSGVLKSSLEKTELHVLDKVIKFQVVDREPQEEKGEEDVEGPSVEE